MPDPVSYQRLVLDEAVVAQVAANPSAASQLTERQAELLDVLARAGFEPRLAQAAASLNYLAIARPERRATGWSKP